MARPVSHHEDVNKAFQLTNTAQMLYQLKEISAARFAYEQTGSEEAARALLQEAAALLENEGHIPMGNAHYYLDVAYKFFARLEKPQQSAMFANGEDTPLFSGTPQPAKESVFIEREQVKQGLMF